MMSNQFVGLKYFHLDLKGAPPRPFFLKILWPLLKKWGVTGVLLEWEDCFPFSGDLSFLWNQVYTPEEASTILHDLRDASLEVIPLVQTFGHLEFVLKHSCCIPMREVPLFPSSLCPSHQHSLRLVTTLLDQVVAFHGANLKRFHIGADEVWHMGLCSRCQSRLLAGETKEDLFLKFVLSVLQYAKEKWPHLEFIMWDDMMRSMDEPLLIASGLPSLVQPMVWHYNSAETFSLPSSMWTKYKIFKSFWAAGAFKGASGGSQLVTPVHHHVSNTQQWIRCLADVKSPLRGFVLTGWARYDHFASLCETLPCGLPTLGICLRVLEGTDFGNELMSVIDRDLSPEQGTPSRKPNPEDEIWQSCRQVNQLTMQLHELRNTSQSILNSEHLLTWMNDWQIKNKRVNPMQIVSLASAAKKVSDEFITLEISLRNCLSEFFYPSMVDEWIETYITSLHQKISQVHQSADCVIAEATLQAENCFEIKA